jgi:hypothetical protein
MATILWQSAVTSFYVYTSNRSKSAINSNVTSFSTQEIHDLSSLGVNNNGGTNYSWTPPTGAVIVSSAGGTFAAPIGYTSLKNASEAFAALNGAAAGTKAVTILLTADVATEAGTNMLANSTNWTSIEIRTNATHVMSGSVAGALIGLSDANNIIFEGRIDGIGSTKSLTFRNTNTGGTATAVTFLNDAL